MSAEMKVTDDNVLIVDDAGIVRLACERALKKAGYKVRTAENGQDALAKLQQKPARVVLLDLKMPVINGLELMRPLRDLWPETEVVIMTAYTDNSMVEECRKLGAMAMVVKPFDDINRVIRIVNKAVVRSRLRQGLPIESRNVLRQMLVEQGWVSNAEFDKAMKLAQQENITPRRAFLKQGSISSRDMEWAAAAFLDIPFVHVEPQMLDMALIEQFPLSLARKNKCLPLFKEDGSVHIVAADPLNEWIKYELEDLMDTPVTLYKGYQPEIEEVISKLEKQANNNLTVKQVEEKLGSANHHEKAAMLSALFEKAALVSVEQARIKHLHDDYYQIEIKGVLKTETERQDQEEVQGFNSKGTDANTADGDKPEIKYRAR